MPRCARVKSFDSIYHIMVRGISDVRLFRCNADKDMYLYLIKKYQDVHLFKVYAYCIMDTHAHIIIDCNGADISKIMHGINQCYAQYYNRTYKRRGHLFQDRFKSVIIEDNDALLSTSAYINKNPKDIRRYNGREEWYFYSSFGIYAGIREDNLHILDPYFILDMYSKDSLTARRKYYTFVKKYNAENKADNMEFNNERAEYRSERRILIRDASPDDIIGFVSAYTRVDKSYVNIKYIKDAAEMKALCALLMRCLCDMSQKDICFWMGNITQSHAARLYNRGIKLVEENVRYKNIISDFLGRKAA